jgi:hypothetical protein
MAVSIKSLARDQLPTAQADLYQAPAGATPKSAIVKNMRFVNVGSETATINVWFKRGSDGTAFRILPKDMAIAPGQLVIENEEVTMESDDRIQGQVNEGGTVDYVISGVERDVS